MIRKLGVLSDTHGRHEMALRAVDRLGGEGVDGLVHCGDIGNDAEGRRVLDALAGELPVWFVWGNTDYDADELAPYAADLGLTVLGHSGQLDADLAAGPVSVHHGHDFRLYDRIAETQAGGYLLSGHTHVPHDHHEHGTRLLNPGALHRAKPKTVATLTLDTDEWRLIEL
ncbi:MAG: metallophosphoesterase family protein [Planctomycetota bacterium]